MRTRRDWACPCPKNGGMCGPNGLVTCLPHALGQGQAQSLRFNLDRFNLGRFNLGHPAINPGVCGVCH